MNHFDRRLVLSTPFEEGVADVASSLDYAGFDVIGIDVGDELRETCDHDFRQYLLLIVSLKPVILKQQGIIVMHSLPTVNMAVCETASGETTVIAAESFQAAWNGKPVDAFDSEGERLAILGTERLGNALDQLEARRLTQTRCGFYQGR